MPLLILLAAAIHLVYLLGGAGPNLREWLAERLPVESSWLGMASSLVEALMGLGFTRVAVAGAWGGDPLARNAGIALGIFLILEGLLRLIYLRATRAPGCASLPIYLVTWPAELFLGRHSG